MSKGLIPEGTYQAINKRGLTEETCRKWGYSITAYGNQTVHCATYRDLHGAPIAQKIRFPTKDFLVLGDSKNCGLYGQHLWRDKGKRVVITEGELDALSVSQAQGNKWPVVSVPHGVSSAKKCIEKALEWLEGFDEVVFLFDNDEHGITAAKECALLLSPGKAKIGKLPLKDASDMLQAGRVDELIQALWGAKSFRPDGIVNGAELWDLISKDTDAPSIPYPWKGLNALTHGLRRGELVTFTAGSGIGKSQVCRELALSLLHARETVGYIALEESTKKTALGIIGLELSRPIHLSREGIADETLRTAFETTVGSDRLFVYNHFGSTDSSNLMSRIRYLARGCHCGWIILDHISIVVSGIGDGDERRLIDNTMTQLRSLVEEVGVGLILVSHLKRPEGKGHEEGAQTSLSQLRGSAAIGQLSDIVFGLERDQQDVDRKHITTVRVLKNRFSGETGVAGFLRYDPNTARLTEVAEELAASAAF